jgi:pre-mRNA cleavage complex 2 protein Pcf11
MHFRQNRTATQNIGKGHTRSWFIGVDDWIHDVADVKGKGRADGPRVTMKEAAAVEAKKRDAELRAMHVVVPPGDEAKSIRCPICQETLKCEFLEDEEEWVWCNAIKKDEKIYHATCHAEASLSATTLAARLKTDSSTSRSRSGTPGTSQKAGLNKSASPPAGIPGAGIKRKADGEGSDGGTPPTKKLALSVTA